MNEGQWELFYLGTDLVLGSDPTLPIADQRGFHHMSAPAIGDTELTVEDEQTAGGDGINFGQDHRGGMLITFDLGLKGSDGDDVVTLSEALKKAWRGDTLRVTPGQLATLCTKRAGRLRQVYGRPRRCSTQHTVPRSAFMLGTCDFQTVNDLWYDPQIFSVTANLAPATSGGFYAPFTTPISTTEATVRDMVIAVGGSADTQPIITINGPVTSPQITVGSWIIKLDLSVGVGQQLIVDCRPWARSVIRSDGASFAGRLGRTRLSNAVLKPGSTYVVSYGGIDTTGTSTMTLAWNNAYVEN